MNEKAKLMQVFPQTVNYSINISLCFPICVRVCKSGFKTLAPFPSFSVLCPLPQYITC